MNVLRFKSNSVILALVGIVIALALLLVPLPFVQLMGAVILVALTIKGLPWVTMGDWDKHGALIWALVETGVPPEDISIGSNPSLTLA